MNGLSQSEPVLAWQFVREDGREQALYAHRRILDALKYAPSPQLARVALSGDLHERGDRIDAIGHEHLRTVDATQPLHAFAVWCVENAFQQLDSIHPLSRAALDVKQRWLRGEANDDELHAARMAVYLQVRDASMGLIWHLAHPQPIHVAQFTAYEVIWIEVWQTEWDRMQDVPRTADWNAQWVERRKAVRARCEHAQNAHLEMLLLDLAHEQTQPMEALSCCAH